MKARALVELGERDRALLEAAGRLRLVTGGQLRRLVFGEPSASSRNARIVRRVLERLTRDELLVRATRSLGGIRGGSSSYVYALTPRGARVLGNTPHRRQTDPSLAFLRHTLCMAEVYVQLFEGLYDRTFDELQVEVEPECWRPLEDGTGALLKPDLFVRAATPKEEVFAWVEVDLGTEHSAAIRRKASLYSSYRGLGREQARWGVFPEVLWLVGNPIRGDTLQRYLQPEQRREPGLHKVIDGGDLINELTKGGEHA